MNNSFANKLNLLLLSSLVIALLCLIGCNAEDAHAEDTHAEDAHDEHAGHNHGTDAADDMDKSVEELFAESCEHGIKAHACDECRYEVGVAKVPANLIEHGLVKLGKVTKRNFDSEIDLIGEINLDERKTAHLSPRVTGIVSRVKVGLGDRVKSGDTIIELESAELAEAQADYLEALAKLGLAKKGFTRQQTLMEKSITSEREFLEAQMLFESLKIRSNSMRQKLLRTGMSKSGVLKLAKKGLSAASGKLLLYAPFDGDVLELHATIGERIESGSDTLLIADTKSLWVWVDLYESQLANIKQAMSKNALPVTITVRAYSDEVFVGGLDYVEKVMDHETRTVKARITIKNEAGKLKPGMFAKVKLDVQPSGSNAVVPSSAVMSDEDKSFVFLHYSDDYFIRRQVQTGREIDGYQEILSGLEVAQDIVVKGAFLLKSDVLRSKMGEGCSH